MQVKIGEEVRQYEDGITYEAIAKDYQAEDTQLWAALDYVREKASQNVGQ